MKKVGILTFHNSINYGAVLQTFALQKYINSLGYNAEIINYINHEHGIKHFSLVRKAIYYSWHMGVKKLLVGNTRENRTRKFVSKNIKLSKSKYVDIEQLRVTTNEYDCYITGSDQVWNPNIIFKDSTYFLTFVPKNKTTISYAPSFGISELSEEYSRLYRGWINEIDHLSVRELEGKNLIENLTGRDSTVTVDPTLLLEKNEWLEFSYPYVNKKPYVLCYHMPGDKIVNKAISDIASKIAKKNNWDVVSIGQKEYMKLVPGNKRIFKAGPSEYLGLFQNASFVVTNSFHGTAFSLIFNKQFYVPINYDLPPKKILSSRISSLLTLLNLENRLISTNDNTLSLSDNRIDYINVNKKLMEIRATSRRFLESSLVK